LPSCVTAASCFPGLCLRLHRAFLRMLYEADQNI